MTIILAILGFIITILIIGRIHQSRQFAGEVTRLFSHSALSRKTFGFAQLQGLPEPVQRYFRHVLRDGQQYIGYVRLTHNGKFKTGLEKKWIDISGEQYFTAANPGFIWRGTTSMFTARDMYIADTGRLVVTLFYLFKVVDGKGATFNEGELQRWLAESVWFPTNLLPDGRISWEAIDENTATLIFKYKSITVSYKVRFNGVGEIIHMETKRYMDAERKETWICSMSGYDERHGILIPIECQASWKLDTGDHPYAKFNVTNIEYNRPERF